MTEDYIDSVFLRRQLVFEITNFLSNWLKDDYKSYAINKHYCRVASELVDYVLKYKNFCSEDIVLNKLSKVDLFLNRNFKKQAFLTEPSIWFGNRTEELISLIFKKPNLLISGIEFSIKKETIKLNNFNELDYILEEIENIFEKYNISNFKIPYKIKSALLSIKYYCSEAEINLDQSLTKIFNKISSVYFSTPWSFDSYLMRKALSKKNVNLFWLDHSGSSLNLGYDDEKLSHLYWLGMNGSIYYPNRNMESNSIFFKVKKRSFETKINQIGKNHNLKNKSIKTTSSRKKLGIIIFPLGDKLSYPHYRCNQWFQLDILIRLKPFFKLLSNNYDLIFLLHPSIKSNYVSWLKEKIIPKQNSNYEIGAFEKYSQNIHAVIFTYTNSSTFYQSLQLQKLIYVLSFTFKKSFQLINKEIQRKINYFELLLPLSLSDKDLKELLIEKLKF